MIADTSAVLAYVFGETGGPVFEKAMDQCSISSANLAEVVAKFLERGFSLQETNAQIDALAIPVIDFDRDTALACGMLRPATRHLGMSLGDRACIALAINRNLPVLTADRTWTTLNLGIEIKLIR